MASSLAALKAFKSSVVGASDPAGCEEGSTLIDCAVEAVIEWTGSFGAAGLWLPLAAPIVSTRAGP